MIGLSKIGRTCRISTISANFFHSTFKMAFSRGKGIVNSIRESSRSPVSSPLSSRMCFGLHFMEIAIKTHPVRREGNVSDAFSNNKPKMNEGECKIWKFDSCVDNSSFRHSFGGSRNILFHENRVDEKARAEMSRLSFVSDKLYVHS